MRVASSHRFWLQSSSMCAHKIIKVKNVQKKLNFTKSIIIKPLEMNSNQDGDQEKEIIQEFPSLLQDSPKLSDTQAENKNSPDSFKISKRKITKKKAQSDLSETPQKKSNKTKPLVIHYNQNFQFDTLIKNRITNSFLEAYSKINSSENEQLKTEKKSLLLKSHKIDEKIDHNATTDQEEHNSTKSTQSKSLKQTSHVDQAEELIQNQ